MKLNWLMDGWERRNCSWEAMMMVMGTIGTTKLRIWKFV